MGQQGKFVISYDVLTARLINDLNRAQEAIRAHGASIGAVMGGGAATTQSGQAYNAFSRQLQTGQRVMQASNRTSQVAAQRFKYLKAATDRSSKSFLNFGRQSKAASKELNVMGLALKRMLLWWSSAAIILGAQRLIKNTLEIAGAFQFVVKELQVLGDDGEAAYTQLAQAGFDAAVSTGRSFNEAADAMKAWVRQGFSANDVAKLTRTTLIGLNLTNLSSIELTRTLTAQMRAFNIPAERSIGIIDTLVGVSRRYAIEAGQLAIGLRRFAASSVEAGVSLEQQTGLMVAMMQRTQQSAQMVGRAGRTITTRLRRNAVEALESIANINSFTDEARTTFRSLWDVLSDLAGAWDKLTQVEREELAFQAAGLRQREFFLALMQDFNLAQEAHIVALASGGLAMKSNTILVESYKKSVAALHTEWEKLLASQSGILGFFQNIVDGLRTIINVAVKVPEAIANISVAVATIGGVAIALAAGKGHPVIAAIIGIAGAITLLLAAIGRYRGTNLEELVQHSRDMVVAAADEAESIQKVAAEYLELASQTDGLKKNADALIVARDKLIELSPRLLEGEDNLVTIYETLKGKVDDLKESTLALTKARDDLARSELILAEARAGRTVRELSPRVEELALNREIYDISDIVNLQKLVTLLREEYTPAIIEATNFEAAWTSKGMSNVIAVNDIYFAQIAILKKRREYQYEDIAMGRASISQKMDYLMQDEAEERHFEKGLRIRVERADKAREARDLAIDMVNAFRVQEAAQKALAEWGVVIVENEKKLVIDAEITEQSLKRKLELLEQEIFLEDALKREKSGIKADDREIFDLGVRVYETKVAALKLFIATTNNTENQKVALKIMAGLEQDGLARLKQRIEQSKIFFAENEAFAEQKRREYDESRKLFDLAEEQERRRIQALTKKTDKEIELTIRSTFEQTKSIKGVTAATLEAVGIRIRLLEREKDALEKAQKEHVATSPEVERAELRVEQAADAVSTAQIAATRAIRKENEEAARIQFSIDKGALDAQISRLQNQNKLIAAQRLSVKFAQDHLDALGDPANANVTELAERRLELQREQTKLVGLESQLSGQVLASVDALIKKREEHKAAIIRVNQGEVAAAKFLHEQAVIRFAMYKSELALRKDSLFEFDAEAQYVKLKADAEAKLLALQLAQIAATKEFREERAKLNAEMAEFEVERAGFIAGDTELEIMRTKLALLVAQGEELRKMGRQRGDEEEVAAKIAEIETKRLEISRRISRRSVKPTLIFKTIEGETLVPTAIKDFEEDMAVLREEEAVLLEELAILQGITFTKEQQLIIDASKLAINKQSLDVAKQEGEALKRNAITVINAVSQLGREIAAGDLTGSSFVSLLGTTISGMVGGVPGAIIGGVSGIISELLNTDDLEESLDSNTLALNRNTATLEDVLERSIGVATVFSLPAQIERFGRIPSLQGGGHITGTGVALVHAGETVSSQHIGTLTVQVFGSQDPGATADEVMKRIDSRYDVDKRRGYVTPLRGR